MSVLVATIRAIYLTEEINNVFTYETASPGTLQGSAEGFARAFDDIIVDAILPAVHTATNFFEVDVYDLMFPANLFTLSINKNGTRAGEAMPRNVAWTARTNRATRDIRRGQKRFGGVSEADQASGTFVAGFITVMNTCCGILNDTFVDQFDAGVAYVPVVVKRIKTVVDGKPRYNFPDNFADYERFVIASWTPNTEVTSQNSRKSGVFVAP